MNCSTELVTALTPNQVQQLCVASRLVGASSSRNGDNLILSKIEKFIKRNTGYAGTPIICMSRIGGSPANLQIDSSDYSIALDVKTGNFLLELKVCEDLICSIITEDFIDLSVSFDAAAGTDDEKELEEELFGSMVLGTIDDVSSVISFIPFVDLKSVYGFSVLLPDWQKEPQQIYKGDSLKTKLMSLTGN